MNSSINHPQTILLDRDDGKGIFIPNTSTAVLILAFLAFLPFIYQRSNPSPSAAHVRSSNNNNSSKNYHNHNHNSIYKQSPFAIVKHALLYITSFILDEIRSVRRRPRHHLHTKIRGQWYDFALFDHPGGPVALNLARDRDATALFESHHLLTPQSKMNKILAKYKVQDSVSQTLQTADRRDDGAHYEWKGFHNDAFVKDIKQVLMDYFEPIAKKHNCTLYQAAKATHRRWAVVAMLFTAFGATLPAYIQGQYWTLLVTPQLAWVLLANYWHDCLHFSMSANWTVNAFLPYITPYFSSPWVWYHQHVIGHHAYTNIGFKDPDLAHAPQLLREHKSIKWKPPHSSQGTYMRVLLTWSVGVNLGLNILSDLRANIKASYNNVVPYMKLTTARLIAHIVGRMWYIFISFVWPFLVFPTYKALIWVIVPNVSYSLAFMINSQINHLTEDCADASDTNFLKHQVKTAQNFGVGSWFCGLYSGRLNHQIEHHLFPFVNHCHLPHLVPMVERVCKKHNVTYNKSSGYVDAFQKHFNHTKELSTK